MPVKRATVIGSLSDLVMKRAVLLAHRGVAAEDAAKELLARAGGSRLALEMALHLLSKHPPSQPVAGHTSIAHDGADTSLRLAITSIARGEAAGA